MGGGGSKSKTHVRTAAAVSAMTRNIMNCEGNTFVTQRFVVSGDYNVISNVKQVQVFKLSNTCANNSKNIADLQQSVSTALKETASSQTEALLGALNTQSSKIDSFIENDISQSITNETVSNIINKVNAMQETIISGNRNIIDTFSQEQTMSILQDACQDAINNTKTGQALNNIDEQDVKSTQTNPISEMLDSIFHGLTGLGMLWVIVIIVAIVVGGYVFIYGNPLGMLLSDGDITFTGGTITDY